MGKSIASGSRYDLDTTKTQRAVVEPKSHVLAGEEYAQKR